MMMIRVTAIYSGSRVVLGVLVTIFLCEMGVMAWLLSGAHGESPFSVPSDGEVRYHAAGCSCAETALLADVAAELYVKRDESDCVLCYSCDTPTRDTWYVAFPAAIDSRERSLTSAQVVVWYSPQICKFLLLCSHLANLSHFYSGFWPSASAWLPLLYDTVVLVLTLCRTIYSIKGLKDVATSVTHRSSISRILLHDGILYFS